MLRTVFIVMALVFVAEEARGQEITGTARALQADQIIMDGQRVSIYGIDAPDPDQDRECRARGRLFGCFSNAKRQLEILLDQGPVTCNPTGETNFIGFPYMTCEVNGQDIGHELVRAGVALAFRPQTDRYVDAEEEARAEGLGLWQEEVSFTVPWEWRQRYGMPLYGP